MSIPIQRITVGATLPIKPVGEMLKGWLPGTIVNFYPDTDIRNNKYLCADWASKFPNNVGAGGFTMNGSLRLNNNFNFKYANDNEPNGLWSADEQIQFTKGEENLALEFDSNKQLSYMGKNITTINFDGGVFKIYTFEKYDEDYLSSDGASGDIVDWESNIGKLMGISSRSLFTTDENSVISEPYEYRVGGVFTDENGKKYVVGVRR